MGTVQYNRKDLRWYGPAFVLAAGSVLMAQLLGYRTGIVILLLAALLPLSLFAFFRWPETGVFLMLILVSFGSEYSQTEWGVRSADQLATIYNRRFIGGLIASPFDVVFASLLLLWLGRKWLRREAIVWLPRRVLAPIILCLVFVIYATVLGLFRLPQGYELYHIMRELRPFVYLLALLVMAVDVLTTRGKIVAFWQLVIVVAMVRGVQGVIRHFLGIGRWYYGTTMVYYDYSDTILMLAGMTFLLLWLLGQKRWHLHTLAVLGIALTPMIYTFIFSFRRSFWIGAAGSLVLLFAYVNNRERRRYLALALAGAGMLLALVLVTGQTALIGQRLASVVDAREDPSNYFRVLDTENALHAIHESGAVGMGFGSRYDVVASVYWLAEFISHVSRASHNGYLYVLMKMGLLGIVAWTLLWVAILSHCYDLLRAPSGSFRHIGLAVGVVLIACAIANLFLPLYYNLRPMLLLGLFSALVVAAWNLQQRELEPS